MRRNITISVDDDFIPVMDKARRGKPRGRWIEELAISRRVVGFERSPTTKRSPEVASDPGEDQAADSAPPLGT
jgi:hypothetical protein